MEKSMLFEIMEEMASMLGTDELLQEFGHAMSSQELQENLEWIDRNHGLGLFEEEEEEEE